MALNTKVGHKKETPLKIKEIVILNSSSIMGRLRGAGPTATTLCDQQWHFHYCLVSAFKLYLFF